MDDLTREQVGLRRLPAERRKRAVRTVVDTLHRELPVLNGQSSDVARAVVRALEERGLLDTGGRVS